MFLIGGLERNKGIMIWYDWFQAVGNLSGVSRFTGIVGSHEIWVGI